MSTRRRRKARPGPKRRNNVVVSTPGRRNHHTAEPGGWIPQARDWRPARGAVLPSQDDYDRMER